MKLKTKSAEASTETVEVTEEVAENTAENTETTETVETVETKADPNEAVLRKLEAIEAKNRELEEKLAQRQTTQPQQQTITSSDLRALGEEARENLEKQYGMTFEQIVGRVEAAERSNANQRELSREAKLNTREALDDAIDRDPQLHKVKGHIREFLDDVSDADKADPARLKRWMDKAVAYAKGKAGIVRTESKGKTLEKSVKPDEEPMFEDEEGDKHVKPGAYNVGNGLRLNIDDSIVPKEVRSKMTKASSGQGVMGVSFEKLDEPAKFK